jgi:transposase
MDVHKENINVAVLDDHGYVKARLAISNSSKSLGQLAKRLTGMGKPRCVYEAGPCGYDVRRFLEGRGIDCEVVAPSLIPRKPGDRVKNDRRDAEKLARMYRAGELTPILVPTPEQEALRDLVRSHEDATEDLLRRRHRILKFLLRQGRRHTGKNWTQRHWAWIRSQKFDDPNQEMVLREYVIAFEQELERLKRLRDRIEEESHDPAISRTVARLRALRGIDTLTAMTIVSELIDLHRFRNPRELMAFVGLVPSEHSSGGRERRFGITKTGNAHVRRVLVESAWHYRHNPKSTGKIIKKRRDGLPPEVVEVARKAELRLYKKYHRMLFRGKSPGTSAVAVARELTGFIWAITLMA